MRIQEIPGQSWVGDSIVPKYYGVVPMEGAHWGGLGYVGGAVAIGLVEQDGVAAHEFGHNFGLLHVDCGGPGGPDPNYPYPNGDIGNVGVDVYQRRIIPSNYKDLMSYCGPEWISDYHYIKIFNALMGSTLQRTTLQGELQEGLFISGRINSDDTGVLNHAEPISTTNLVESPGSGDYRVELRDSVGVLQFSYAFDPVPIESPDGIPQPSDFGFVVPLIADLGSIQLWQDTNLLATLTAASGAPTLSAWYEPSSSGDLNEITVSWQSSSPDGSPTYVNLRYSADSEQTWHVLAVGLAGTASLDLNMMQLPGSANGLIEVIASNTTEVQTVHLELGELANKSPQVGIVGDQNIQLYPGEPLALMGVATDLEDGSIADDNLHWSDSQMGELGTGYNILLHEGLSLGDHTITLTAIDSDGNTTTASINVSVDVDVETVPALSEWGVLTIIGFMLVYIFWRFRRNKAKRKETETLL